MMNVPCFNSILADQHTEEDQFEYLEYVDRIQQCEHCDYTYDCKTDVVVDECAAGDFYTTCPRCREETNLV